MISRVRGLEKKGGRRGEQERRGGRGEGEMGEREMGERGRGRGSFSLSQTRSISPVYLYSYMVFHMACLSFIVFPS